MSPPDPSTLTITGRTMINFIMGDPIDHVRGTAMLNAAWARMGRDQVTVPLHVRPDDLPQMLDMLRRTANVTGTGITIPHKIAAAALVDHLTDAAAQLGTVNVIRRNADGTLTGHNIDGAGFLAGLAAHGVALKGQRIALAGAGGVARAIAFALAGSGAAALRIRNRDTARAQALAAEITAWPGAAGCHVSASATSDGCTLLVNGTALGMRDADPLPFAEDELHPALTLAEVVMTPEETRFLALGAALGCTTVPGAAMMHPQADLLARFLDGDPA